MVTLAAGAFAARELLEQCTRTPWGCPVQGSQALVGVVKAHQRHGYDVIVQVGLARYLGGKQREEIRAELRQQRGIELSSGTVSALADRFLLYVESLHHERASALRETLRGGYALHLDATCEHGKGGLFVCMDGLRQWVLVAGRIASEHKDHLEPLVKKTVALFGDPVATVRDMGEGGAGAVEFLAQRGIPDLICHYHFLGAVGTKLFDEPYTLLRRVLQGTGLRTELHTLLRTLRRYCDADQDAQRFGSGTVRENLPALVRWILDGTATKDLCFPFSLPHFELVRRCHQAPSRAEHWVAPSRTQPERRALRHLASLLARLDRDERIPATVKLLESRWQAFSELRDVLRLTNADLPGGDQRSQQKTLPALELCRLKEIETAVKRYKADLEGRLTAIPAEQRQPSSEEIILKYFKRYGAHLFGHPALYDEDGSILGLVERTNNTPEHFFGQSKQRLRRRLGRAHLGHDLAQQPAQAALVQNLRHADYVSVLCGSFDNLAACFAALDKHDVSIQASLHRDHRDSKLLRRIRALIKHDLAAAPVPAPLPSETETSATVF